MEFPIWCNGLYDLSNKTYDATFDVLSHTLTLTNLRTARTMAVDMGQCHWRTGNKTSRSYGQFDPQSCAVLRCHDGRTKVVWDASRANVRLFDYAKHRRRRVERTRSPRLQPKPRPPLLICHRGR